MNSVTADTGLFHQGFKFATVDIHFYSDFIVSSTWPRWNISKLKPDPCHAINSLPGNLILPNMETDFTNPRVNLLMGWKHQHYS